MTFWPFASVRAALRYVRSQRQTGLTRTLVIRRSKPTIKAVVVIRSPVVAGANHALLYPYGTLYDPHSRKALT
jgi:hypothetical protein